MNYVNDNKASELNGVCQNKNWQEVIEFLCQKGIEKKVSRGILISVIKTLYTKPQQFCYLIYSGSILKDEKFYEEAKILLDENSLIITNYVKNYFFNNKSGILNIKDKNLILFLGDILQEMYIYACKWLGSFIVQLYKKLKIYYNSPLSEKIYRDICKVYNFSDEDILPLYEKICQYEKICNNFKTEKGLILYLKSVFFNNYNSRNLKVLPKTDDIFNLLRESAYLGCDFADKVLEICEEPRPYIEKMSFKDELEFHRRMLD